MSGGGSWLREHLEELAKQRPDATFVRPPVIQQNVLKPLRPDQAAGQQIASTDPNDPYPSKGILGSNATGVAGTIRRALRSEGEYGQGKGNILDLLPPLAAARAAVGARQAAGEGNYVGAALASLPFALPGDVGGPLKGLAQKLAPAAERGVPELRSLVETMRAGHEPLPRITSIPQDKGQMLAKVYESLPKNDPAAKASYDALNAEVAKQAKRLQDAGYRFEFVNEDPYKSSAEMVADVRDNKRLKVFKTPSDNFHPYMTPEQNDLFRGVHDLVAHAAEGHQFGPVGEENAYRVHHSTLPPEAHQALASETRGQNSWVNFGPNAHLPVKERPFAEQKAALFPAHLTGDYDAMEPNVQTHTFEHYSRVPDLSELDPAYMGTGQPGAEKNRPNRIPVMHVYAPGTEPEPQFRGLPKYKVTVKGSIYDVAKDPAGVVKELQRQVRDGEIDRSEFADRLEQQISKAGYAGYHNSENYGGIYKLFGKNPAERVNPGTSVFDGTGLRGAPPSLQRAMQTLGDSVVTKAAPAIVTPPNSGNVFDVSKLGLAVPEGYNTDRPPVKYPTARADVSMLKDIPRKFKQVYTPNVQKAMAENPAAAGWYDMSQLRDAFRDQSPTGDEDFRRFMLFHGPTSTGTTVPDNVRQASQFYYLHKNGALNVSDLENGTLDLPPGYRNRRQASVNSGINKIITQGNLDPINSPKTFRYANELAGNYWGGAALDMHVGRQVGKRGLIAGEDAEGNTILNPAVGFPTSSFNKNKLVQTSPVNSHYPIIEDALIQQAQNLGLTPTQYQALGWVGGGAHTGVADARPLLDIFNEKLRTTAGKYGYASPLDALHGFIRGQTPLWSLILGGAGLGAAGTAASQASPDEQY